MRIRKRFLSLAAALAASPPSDHLAGDQPPSSSDHTTQIGVEPSTKEVESEKKKEIIKSDDTTREESILCAKGNSHDIGWVEGDRVIPAKKKRGSHGKSTLNHDIQEVTEMIEGTMKSKAKTNKKNEKRGSVIMEGSRCSRVNGRGWRCAQQTLVGYSLCEHHLGKGRLRSMTNVRGREQKVELKKPDNKEDEVISMDHHDFKDDEKESKYCEEEQVSSSASVVNISKRRKLGVVKARSLSSLLSQTAN